MRFYLGVTDTSLNSFLKSSPAEEIGLRRPGGGMRP